MPAEWGFLPEFEMVPSEAIEQEKWMMRKTWRVIVALTLILTLAFGCVVDGAQGEESIVEMPSLSRVLLREADGIKELEDESRLVTYSGITEEDFEKWSEYLEKFGCELVNYEVKGNVFSAVLGREGKQMRLSYYDDTKKMTLEYPTGTKEETVDIAALVAREAKLAPFKTVGTIVTFGTYEQDNNASNGKEEIEWQVLDVQEEKALLLSKFGLDAKPYNKEYTDITWEKCTLRKWLNGEFMNSAFSEKEKAAILTTGVDNSASQGYSKWSTNGGNNTQDQIFLLSYAEANKYLDVTSNNSSNLKSRVSPTAYAKAQGAYTSDNNKTEEGNATGWWWLRSPGYFQNRAACVHTDGSLDGRDNVSIGNAVVRPAFWINLDSDIF